MTTPELSVIIPAFNEERLIAQMIEAVRAHTGAFQTEIIVVDNGSRDRTRELARAAGAHQVVQASGTVAAVRNAGAALAKAPIFVFLDADVFLTPQWARRMLTVIKDVPPRKMLTGSWVSVPDECTWIERHWFKPLEHGGNSHINSGHLIISRALFEEIGGFDAALRTGEDVDISHRAAEVGADVLDDPLLKVIHEGYPKSLGEFIRREIWHGTGDCQSVRGFMGSKIAIIGALMVHIQLVAWFASILLGDPTWGILASAGAIGVCFLASIYRYRSVPLVTRLTTTVLYYFYFLARGLSLYRRSTGRKQPVAEAAAGRH